MVAVIADAAHQVGQVELLEERRLAADHPAVQPYLGQLPRGHRVDRAAVKDQFAVGVIAAQGI